MSPHYLGYMFSDFMQGDVDKLTCRPFLITRNLNDCRTVPFLQNLPSSPAPRISFRSRSTVSGSTWQKAISECCKKIHVRQSRHECTWLIGMVMSPNWPPPMLRISTNIYGMVSLWHPPLMSTHHDTFSPSPCTLVAVLQKQMSSEQTPYTNLVEPCQTAKCTTICSNFVLPAVPMWFP